MRVAIFGNTGHGNYGHQIDLGFANQDGIEICAVADPDDTGRADAMKRLSVSRGYREYAELLEKERPDIVAVAPRFPDQHAAMVTAALRARCHVYCEKPLAVTLDEADAMVNLADEMGVYLAIALPFVHEPRYRQVLDLLESQAIGRITHLRAFTKCDGRGGGQDLAVLGPHLFDMMRRFGGDPQSCFASIREGSRPANQSDIRNGDEFVGPVAGDGATALFSFADAVTAVIDTVRTKEIDPSQQPYRLEIYGDRGALAVRAPYGDHGIWMSTSPCASPLSIPWQRLPTSHLPDPASYHRLAVIDLIDAIRHSRVPLATGRDGRWALEMGHAIYASHYSGQAVRFPLQNRAHPLKADSLPTH